MHVGGLVEAFSGLTGTGGQHPGAGPITVVSGCKLIVEDTGKISSEGQDPGADLVHLEGCDVVIQGLVQSVAPGKGHVAPTTRPNHCNLDPSRSPRSPRFPSTKGASRSGAIRSRSTAPARTRARSTLGMRSPGRAWIDIFARGDITIIADTALLNYSVNADACNGVNAPGLPCSNSLAGLVNIKSQSGKVVMTALDPATNGLAVSASAIVPTGVGGLITVEAGGASGSGSVDFNADSLVARSNGSQLIGRIFVQSFNDQVLGVSPGSLNTLVPSVDGAVNLTACVGDPASYVQRYGHGNEDQRRSGGGCGGTPTFPTVAQWYTGRTVAQFSRGGGHVRSGLRHDVHAQRGQVQRPHGQQRQGSRATRWCRGSQVHLFDKTTLGATVHLHTVTDINGAWTFSVPPGEYIVCEEGGPAPHSPAQTFPTSDFSGGLCATHIIPNVAGSRGYDIVLSVDVNACTSTDNDFGNFFGASISGQKFNDLANNGVKDAGDPPVTGTQIHLFLQAGGGDQHQLTDASGNFVFTPVAPGDYYLCETGGPAPNAPQQTFPASDGSGGACATHTGVAGSRGYAITLSANQAVVNQDFGNFFGGMVSGQKFSDLANDGVLDAGDPPVPGLQIILIDKGTGGGTVNLTTTTDAIGNFSFGLILPGEYYLCEQAGPAPNIPAQTFPASDETGGTCATRTGIAGSRGYDIVLGVNGTSSNKDFGNFYGGTLTVNKVLVPAADAGRFNLQIDGTSPNAGSDNVGDGGTTGAVIVNAGSHSFGETGGTIPATVLTDYTTTWTCSDGTAGGGTSGSVNVTSGSAIVCTITNTRKPITTPTFATVASPGGALGTALTDTATLSGATPLAGGTITFVLYGPNNATCANPAIFTSNPIAVNGNGTYTSAPGFTPTLPGTYRWRASYSGDANNAAVSDPCNAPNESAVITGPPPPPPGPPTAEIPTLDSKLLAALGILLAVGGAWALRRRESVTRARKD